MKKNVLKNIKKTWIKSVSHKIIVGFPADVPICKKQLLTLNISLEQGYIENYCLQISGVICEEKCFKKY